MIKNTILCLFTIFIISATSKAQTMNIEIFTVGTIVIDNKVNGSAFVLTNPNLVVTCAHVLTPNSTYYYKPQSVDSLYMLKPIFIDNEKDLALLVSEKNIVKKPLNPVLEFNVKPGQHLFYMGFNKNISKNGTPIFQVDNAQVSSIGITKIGNSLVDFIEFNGVGIPGYSGGPVFNDDGNVVGLMREAWQKQGVKGGEVLLINRAFSIIPIIEKIPFEK